MSGTVLLGVLIGFLALVHQSVACGDPRNNVPVLGHYDKSYGFSHAVHGIDFVELASFDPASGDYKHVLANDTFVDTSLGGYKFWFKTEANLKAFQANPEKYAPKIGGYCAFTMSGFDTYAPKPLYCYYASRDDPEAYIRRVSPVSGKDSTYMFFVAGAQKEMVKHGDIAYNSSETIFEGIRTKYGHDGHCFNNDLVVWG